MWVYGDAGPGDASHQCFVPQGGMYWLVLLDDYSAGFGLMVVVIATCLVVTRVYGTGSVPRGARGTAGCLPACCRHLALGQRQQLLSPCPSPSPRHKEVLPRHPHDAGLQTRALLQGVLDGPVPGHNDGNCWAHGAGWCQHPWVTSPCARSLCWPLLMASAWPRDHPAPAGRFPRV